MIAFPNGKNSGICCWTRARIFLGASEDGDRGGEFHPDGRILVLALKSEE